MESEEIAVPPAEVTPIATEPVPPPATAIAPPVVSDETTLRREWAERIRGEARLPGGLRQHLATAVEVSASMQGEGPEPRLTVSQIAEVFAAALPSWVVDTPRVAEHPHGQSFFLGSQVTGAAAAEIARQQLQRTGFHRES